MARILSRANPKGAGQRLTTILLDSFLFKSAMAAEMNPLFEQDSTFPFCGSAEDRAAFYSAKLSRSDVMKSGPAPTAGGPIRKPRRTKVVLKMQYSKQCKKVLGSMSDSDDNVSIFGKKPSAQAWDSDDEPIFDFTEKVEALRPVNINVRAQVDRIHHGESKVQLIRPLPEANLAADVEMLMRACIQRASVTSVELLVSHNRPFRRCTGNDLSGGREPLSAQ
jgi:hypothetical protein